ncbi:MAG: 30S ribosomal protein S4e [Candidatus Asgardarchaeia archaeon]
MGKKGKTLTQKRISAPKVWKIPRKGFKFAPRTIPGPHPREKSIPLQIIIRDLLGYALTRSEAKKILNKGHVAVDGRIRRELKFPVGIMDVVSILPTGEHYRVFPGPKDRLILHPISADEANIKPCYIKNKHTIKGGYIQLTLHDGRNIIIYVKDPRNPVEDVYKTHDTLVITIPDQEIKEQIALKEGVLGLVISGKNMGYLGKIKTIRKSIGPHANIVELMLSDGRVIETTMDYIFPFGVEKPVVSVPEVLIK